MSDRLYYTREEFEREVAQEAEQMLARMNPSVEAMAAKMLEQEQSWIRRVVWQVWPWQADPMPGSIWLPNELVPRFLSGIVVDAVVFGISIGFLWGWVVRLAIDTIVLWWGIL